MYNNQGYGGGLNMDYAYRGGGLLDDDPRGLKKHKSLTHRLARHFMKIVVVVLMLVALAGWVHSHKHKKALGATLDSTLSTLSTAHQEKGEGRVPEHLKSPPLIVTAAPACPSPVSSSFRL
jgi:hypothetical protein